MLHHMARSSAAGHLSPLREYVMELLELCANSMSWSVGGRGRSHVEHQSQVLLTRTPCFLERTCIIPLMLIHSHVRTKHIK
mmetsp:Transcript_40586/g.97074  ORF Transcript_40586/g.97074 Transcript_40586/m.97074 type:complete len:81 (-) Transcript_40586:245-487(-)